jgi:hypothetical protein
MKGIDTHAPRLRRPINAAEYAIVLDFCRSPNIVNYKKIEWLTIKKYFSFIADNSHPI